MLAPWLLIIIGVIFLLENLNLIPAIKWSIVWPIILILAGVYMLKKKSGDGCCNWWKGKKDTN
jgi:predicted membrane protein